MSQGNVKQFVDFTNTTDTGDNSPDAIQPIIEGEDVIAAVQNRPPENVRQRTEVVKEVLADTLYLRDADRVLALGGPGLIDWPGSTTVAQTGIPVISDDLYLLPFLTPGAAQTAPVPPVASNFGTLILQKVGPANGIVVTSNRRSFRGGDQISVEVVFGGSSGSVVAELLPAAFGPPAGDFARRIRLTCNAPTLTNVINALNAISPPTPDNAQLVTATLAGGAAGGDTLLVPQTKQFVSGNYDGEGHAITPAALAAFFVANPGSALAEGDSLCIQYAQMVDETYASNSGRRQSIPENSNTAVPSGAFFNSRVNPEKLVNAIPICKVIDGKLVMINGTVVAEGSTSMPLGGSSIKIQAAGVDQGSVNTLNFVNLVVAIAGDIASVTWAGETIQFNGVGVTNTPHRTINVDNRELVASDQGSSVAGLKFEAPQFDGLVGPSMRIRINLNGTIDDTFHIEPNHYWIGGHLKHNSATVDKTASSALGGSLASDTWYYLYVYSTGTGPTAIDFELSTTAPSAGNIFKNGDTSRIFLGAFRSISIVTNIMPTLRQGRKTHYIVMSTSVDIPTGGSLIAAPTGTKYVDVSSRVPPTALLVLFQFLGVAVKGTTPGADAFNIGTPITGVDVSGSSYDTLIMPADDTTPPTWGVRAEMAVDINQRLTLSYNNGDNANGKVYVYVMGYVD